jgi:hypothetical protein
MYQGMSGGRMAILVVVLLLLDIPYITFGDSNSRCRNIIINTVTIIEIHLSFHPPVIPLDVHMIFKALFQIGQSGRPLCLSVTNEHILLAEFPVVYI